MMNRIVPLLTCFSLVFASVASAGLVSQRSAANDALAEFTKRMPPKQAAIATATREAETVGWDIYRTEALADIAGYAAAANLSSTQRGQIDGSIVVAGASEWTVRFYAKNDRGFAPVADIVFDINDRAGLRRENLAPFTAQELALIRATELVNAKENPCDDTFKTITLPRIGKDGITVYKIRQCMDDSHFPVGQHTRYAISPDGQKIVAEHEFARRCNTIATSLSDDKKHEEVRLTTSLDPQPTEVQVYLSIRYGLDIFLATTQSNLYWQIDRGVSHTD